jgi:hypothetical protein
MDRARRAWIAVGVVLVVAVAALAVWIARGGDGDDAAGGGATTSRVAATETSTTEPGQPDFAAAVWPQEGNPTFDDPVAAARSFAVDYVGFRDPIMGEFQAGDARSGEVELRAIATGPATTVALRQLGADDKWFVLGASTADIEIDVPRANSTVSSPMRVLGRARAFEGTVLVEARDDEASEPLGRTAVTGSGSGELGPFTGEITFAVPRTRHGAIVFATESAEDGRRLQATVIRVAFIAAPAVTECAAPAVAAPGAGETGVQVFFTCSRTTTAEPVIRLVPASDAVLRAAVGELLKGPNPEEKDAGFVSSFSSETADMLANVTIDAEGKVVVDFHDLRPVMPNASSATGSQQLLSELDSTVFQFPTVRSVEYRIEGSCNTFYDWLQRTCEVRPRN